jgi:hypothetical protein
VAFIDDQGVIVSVNDRWRRFGTLNALACCEGAVGMNYLEVV